MARPLWTTYAESTGRLAVVHMNEGRVRSLRIASGSVAAGASALVFTCPADHTALLKDVALQGSAASSNTVVSVLAFSPTGQGCVVARATLAANASFRLVVWVAVDPGGRFEVNNAGPGVANFWLSGALLPGVVPPVASTRPS